MLLNVDEVRPVALDMQSAELAIVSVRYGKRPLIVLWLGIKQLPSGPELQTILSACFFSLAASPGAARFILHIERVGEEAMDPPTFDTLRGIASALLANREKLRTHVYGSILQITNLDEKSKMLRDLFLSTYTPGRPMRFTDDPAEVEEFVRQIANQVASTDNDTMTARATPAPGCVLGD